MPAKQLIYESAAPVSKTRHAGWSVEVGTDYAFSRKVNSVPLMAVEFPGAAAEYAIVFAGNEEAVMPAVILGMREQENLYLGPLGGWQAKYIPAFLRRYPFVFSSQDDGKNFELCIDEGFAGFNQVGRGERLFARQARALRSPDREAPGGRGQAVVFSSVLGAASASAASSSAMSRRPCSVSATSFLMSWRCGAARGIWASSYSLKRFTILSTSSSEKFKVVRTRAAASSAEANTSRTAGTPISVYS